MNNSVPIQRLEDITIRPLAPIIPMKSVPKENNTQKRRILKTKTEKKTPEFYDKPIYRSKKYDLL
jgi:hypothetical protein